MENSMSRENENNIEEESGWTMYFDDFFNKPNCTFDQNSLSFSSSSGFQSSMISDAASSVMMTKVAAAHNNDKNTMLFSLDDNNNNNKKNLNLIKKRKTKVHDVVDNDLEDTASSPAHSPKVCNIMHPLNRKPEQKNIMNISQEKASTSGGCQRDDDRRNTTELKKRGLCLVPLSMIVNYLD